MEQIAKIIGYIFLGGMAFTMLCFIASIIYVCVNVAIDYFKYNSQNRKHNT